MRAVVLGSSCSVITLGLTTVAATHAVALTPPSCRPTLPVAGGQDHSAAVDNAGTVWDWGFGGYGQLGDGTQNSSPSPVHVPGLTDVVAVASGEEFTLALTGDGTVHAWGVNSYGELGDASFGDSASPVTVSGVFNVIAIAANWNSALALTSDGTLWGWGQNTSGQLGNGTTINARTPVQVTGLTNVVGMAMGMQHALAVTSDDHVYAWGAGNQGQLGVGDGLNHITPVQVPGISTAVGVAAGDFHSLAVMSSGAIDSWGSNAFGQLGDGNYSTSYAPVGVAGAPTASSVTAGSNTSGALSSGAVWMWGDGRDGEYGNGTLGYGFTPSQVPNVSGVLALTGGVTPLTVNSAGRFVGWGGNSDGQLGVGNTADPQTTAVTLGSPTQSVPAALTNFGAVAGDGVAYVTWLPSSSLITQVTITPYANGVAQAPITTSALGDARGAYAVPNLTQGVTYTFTVTPQNCIGNGSTTSQTSGVVPTPSPLSPTDAKLEGQRMWDRASLAVNTYNGNLNLTEDDLDIAGIAGLDLVEHRTYNSLAAASNGPFGYGWSSTLTDLSLSFPSSNAVYFHGPGGYTAGFAQKTTTTYDSPAGVDADLVKNSDGSFTLTYHTSGEHYQFNASGQLTRDVDRNGNQISYTYAGPNGALSTVTDSRNRQLQISYGGAGHISQLQDVTGRTWKFGYDGAGNLTGYTDPAGNPVSFGYDTQHRMTSLSDPNHFSTNFTYDGGGRLHIVSSTDTIFTYGSATTSVTDGDGHTTSYYFDQAGRTAHVFDAAGNTTSLAYTSLSNVATYQVAGSGPINFNYNQNSLTRISIPTGANTNVGYTDGQHPYLPTTVTDPRGNLTRYGYDTNGNVTTETDPLSSQNQVQLSYNPNGTIATSSTPAGHVSRYGYDANSNLTSITPPAPLGAIHLQYDALSRISSITDGKGQTTQYTYDLLDRVTKVTYADGTSVAYNYDANGNVTKIVDGNGSTTYAYNVRNRITSQTDPDGVITAYGYDNVGNLTRLTDPGGEVDYTYNPVNLATRITDPTGSIQLSYDAHYNCTTVDYPNAVEVTNSYDPSERLAHVLAVANFSTKLADITYSFTPPAGGDSDLLQQTNDQLAGQTTGYGYDPLGRLTSARTTTTPTGTFVSSIGYGYDGDSNRTSETTTTAGQAPTTVTSSYDAADELTSRAGVTYSYDADGNLTGSSDGSSYSYNAANQTVQAIVPTQQAATRYRYRGAGQADRIAAEPIDTSAAGTPVTAVTNFENTLLGLSATRTGPPSIANFSAEGQTVDPAKVTASYFTRDPRGNLLAERTPSGSYYYIQDHAASIIGLTDKNQALVGKYTYDPYGITTNSDPATASTQSATDPTSVTAATDNPLRYISGTQDATALDHFGARYYDPVTARFTQLDSSVNLLDPVQWNRYSYGGDDPTNFSDPEGTCGGPSQNDLIHEGVKLLRDDGIDLAIEIFTPEGKVKWIYEHVISPVETVKGLWDLGKYIYKALKFESC